MDCESIGYSSYYVSSPFNPEELCSRQPNGFMEEFYDDKYPPQFIRNLKKFKGLVSGNNVTSDANEICLKNIQYKAEVTFQLDLVNAYAKYSHKMMLTLLSRWYFGTIYWYQYSQHGGGHFLVFEIFCQG